MTRKKRRMVFVLASCVTLGIATSLVLTALEDSVVFFHSPTDIATRHELQTSKKFRLGGLVKQGSWSKSIDGLTHQFFVTDLRHQVSVSYKGILPDLFREGQGVVVEGLLQADGRFRADEVLAKHDENYMPKEVAEALKKSGKWKGPMKK